MHAGWQLWLALQTGYEPTWGHFWTAAVVLFALALAYIFASMLGPVLGRLRPFIQRVKIQAERTRDAAISGDDRLAPLAAEQPEPLPTAELPIGPVQFGPFAPTRRHRSRPSLARPLAGALFTGGMTAVLAAVFFFTQSLLDDGPIGAWMRPMFLIMLGLFTLIAVMSLIEFAFNLVRRLRGAGRTQSAGLTTDDWGVRLVGGGRRTERESLAWHEVRAFYKADDVFRLQGQVIRKSAPQSTTYTIATNDRVLSWTVWEDSSDDLRAASERLCRLVAARTRLPLRDVTAFATQLAADVLELVSPLLLPLPDRRISIETSAGTGGHATAVVATFAPSTSPTTRRLGATWPRWLMATRVAALALAVAAVAVGLVAQGVQGFQYDNLITQQIPGETPYYTIDFRTNDGKWPSRAATADDGSYTYQSDGYYMTGASGGRPMEAVLPDRYGDATVELTAGLKDVTPPGDIGVVLRESDEETDRVVFSLTSSGGWALARYHEALGKAAQRTVLMSNDHSDAVCTGIGSYNYLAVIMRGADYLCFVRNRLVGIYHDPSGETPRQGHAGLWLGNSRAVGWFSYFSVYPAG